MSDFEAIARRAIEAQGKYDPDDIIEQAKHVDLDKPEPVLSPPRGEAILGERDD